MPNWAYNTLTIKHKDAETLKKIKEELKGDAKGQSLDFNKVIPMPKELDVTSPLRKDDLMFYILIFAKNRAEILELPREILKHVQSILDGHKTDKSLRELLQKYMQDYAKLVIAGTAEKKDEHGFVTGISLLQGHHYFMNIARYGVYSWYDWCCAMWNTKWNACCNEVNLKGDTLTYQFDTAWSGPWPIAAAISALYEGTTVIMNTSYEDPKGLDSVTYCKGQPTLVAHYPQIYKYNDTAYESYDDAAEAAENDGLDDADACSAIEWGIDDENPIYRDAAGWDVGSFIINYAKSARKSA